MNSSAERARTDSTCRSLQRGCSRRALLGLRYFVLPLLPVLLTLAGPFQQALAVENLVRNEGFEKVESSGAPVGWQASGDSRLVSQSLRTEEVAGRGRVARLECTSFRGGNPAAHAMICQYGVKLRRGATYRLSFQARADAIASDIVSVAISDTAQWENCGLNSAFVPAAEWLRHEFLFRASRDCGEKSRLQIWFQSTGTLWLDNVVCEEAGSEDLYHPGQIIPAAGVRNLIPNASFECGTDGWGSEAWDRSVHWGGGMNALFGETDNQQARDGQHSLRIELTPQNQPVSYFDYYELARDPIRAPLAGNQGYIEVEPSKDYVFSSFLKAAVADTPALLAVRQFNGRSFEKAVRVGAEWQRFELTFKPTSRWCYVLAGPDLRAVSGRPQPPESATLWLDAMQLEPGSQPGDFAPRQAVEFGLATENAGNVFGWDEPIAVQVPCVSYGGRGAARLEFWLTDFFDRRLDWRAEAKEGLDHQQKTHVVRIPPRADVRGFLRFHARTTSGEMTAEKSIRLASIPVHRAADSRFGMNHAYAWPHLLDLSRKAGLVWVRDWSIKWQEVEPEKGRFDFLETDFQIDRPLRHDLKVLGLLPFPSSNWSSSAPESVAVTDRYPANRARVAYAPRDEQEFAAYVSQSVQHYRERIDWWQCFNEPIFTDYSLPRKHGYTGADYARWVKVFAQAVRDANPRAKVLAGIGASHEGIQADFEQFFAAGGLAAADAVDIHHYPRLRPPEYMEEWLQRFNKSMDEHGGRKPIWLTEYGYYADDEPHSVPISDSGFDSPLASEVQQAAYVVRWTMIMLAGGVEKIFYHAGTCDGLNRDSMQGIFYEYGGTPHKVYAAQAVMASLFTPACRFVKRLDVGEGVRGYLFRDGERVVACVWAPSGAKPRPLHLANDRMQLLDLMRRPQSARRFTPDGTPVYIVADGMGKSEFKLQ